MEYYDFDGEPITMQKWTELFKSPDRIFGKTKVNGHQVSTVWLGIDHGWGLGGPPVIFETMVFCEHGSDCDWQYEQRRYSTKEAALRGHAVMCNNVTGVKGGESEGHQNE